MLSARAQRREAVRNGAIRALDHPRRHGGGRLCGLAPPSPSGANSDLKAHKTRIPNFRKVRNRSGLTIAVLVVFTLLLLRALVG
jgi:hypothetical protein